MNQVIANLLVLVTVVTLVLLALQAEPVTATIGYVLAGIFMLALIATVIKKG